MRNYRCAIPVAAAAEAEAAADAVAFSPRCWSSIAGSLTLRVARPLRLNEGMSEGSGMQAKRYAMVHAGELRAFNLFSVLCFDYPRLPT